MDRHGVSKYPCISGLDADSYRKDTAQEAPAQIWCVVATLSLTFCPDTRDRCAQMKAGVFREEYIAIIVKELLKGLEYLHQEGKLHRDIKGKRVGDRRASSTD